MAYRARSNFPAKIASVVEAFVKNALELARDRPNLKDGQKQGFETGLYRRVSEETGLKADSDELKIIYRAVWWRLLCPTDGEPPVLDYIQPKSRDEKIRIGITEGVENSTGLVGHLVDDIMSQYSCYIIANLHGLNNSHQQAS